MSEFDPMQETNEKFYDIINQDDWNFDFGREFEIQDTEMEEFTPPVMQYWLPTPIAGVHLRIDFVIEDGSMQQQNYTVAENWGDQLNFMVPLDREGLNQCKRIAKRQEEKMRLDYELVRALKCAELRQRGFTFHPKSEMVVLCQDIVPISALQPPKKKKKFWQR